MPDPTLHPRKESKEWSSLALLLACVAGVVVAAVMQGAASRLGNWPAFDGRFLGPDSYMRLLRVRDCWGGACPDGVFPRSNAPFGEVLHWPQLLDWLIAALAAPLRLGLGWAESVTTAGYLVGPVLEVAAVVAVVLAARQVVAHPVARGFAGVFLASQLWVTWAFAPARPDHHGLQALLFLVAVAAAVRLMVGPRSRPAEVLLGASVAGALWVSVEGLVTVTLPLAIVAIRWVWTGEARWARTSLRVFAWATLTLALAVAFDGPEAGRLAVAYDRVSIAHLGMFGLATVVWLAVAMAADGRPLSVRMTALVGGMSMAAVAASLLFPGLPHGPLTDVDPRIIPIWLDQVSEYVPLLERPSARALVEGLGPLVVALPASVWAWSRARDGRAWAWALVSICLIWFAALGAFHGSRWSYYLQFLLPLPYAWLLGRSLVAAGGLRRPMSRAAAQVGSVTALVVLLPLVLALVATGASSEPVAPSGQARACAADELLRVVPPSILAEEGSVVVAPIWWGPEIMFRTRLDVVATPYHRNHAGILASRDIMASTDDSELLELLRQREVRYITACRLEPWMPLLTDTDPQTLFSRLMRNEPPGFLTPLPLPSGARDHFGLWAVVPDGARP